MDACWYSGASSIRTKRRGVPSSAFTTSSLPAPDCFTASLLACGGSRFDYIYIHTPLKQATQVPNLETEQLLTQAPFR